MAMATLVEISASGLLLGDCHVKICYIINTPHRIYCDLVGHHETIVAGTLLTLLFMFSIFPTASSIPPNLCLPFR